MLGEAIASYYQWMTWQNFWAETVADNCKENIHSFLAIHNAIPM